MQGSRLRQYVIADKLGEGGMGVVWKAHDTTLDRDVALKILPADSASREISRERFFREARAASALNHPNIVTVYEINSDADVDFIAMELVEGETLSARLERGAMPIGAALDVARQIADALARAHKAGIVHRDLKPGNVMINHDGLVKVLDFGLAKVDAHRTDKEQTGEETRLALTRAGTAIGTLGYMSPEQAIGDVVDARSDVFSFGVVLYLMLAGALPFEGNTNTALLRALHFAEPKDLASVRADVPAWLASVVRKALAKEPTDRFQHMGEVATALRQPPPPLPPPLPPPPLPQQPVQTQPVQTQPLPPPFPVVDVPVSRSRRTRREGRQRRSPRRRALGWLIAIGFIAYGTAPWQRIFHRNEPAPAVTDTSPAAADVASTLQRAADLARKGEPHEALAQLARIPREQTLTPQMLVRVAMVRELAGDRDGALDAIARALKGGFPQRELDNDPDFAELRRDARYHRLTAGLAK
jgi:serine/threonine protein kinase